MVMLVLSQIELLDDVLAAWAAISVSGVTILESIGIHRHQQQRKKRLAMRFPFEQGTPQGTEIGHYTLLSVVPDESWVLRCQEAAESVMGDLNNPHTGILASWPLTYCKGVGGGSPGGEGAP
jgi:hypothetical protein